MRNQSYKVIESKADVVTLACKRGLPCTWRLHARRKNPLCSEAFTITAYNGPHSPTCVGTTVAKDHTHLDIEFISFHIRELVQADTSLKICVIQEVMKQQFKYDISYKKGWLAKQRAIAHIFGDWEKSYEDLPHFMQAIKESNSGTVVHFANQKTGDPTLEIFERVFWSFGPSIEGFKHCRPIITIDGTHLYGKYHGTLLIAMGVDANNQLFPLAFALVEGENGSSWPWFMACIRSFVTQRDGLCVISDRHVGIMKAMKEPYSGWQEPHAHHRLCIRHLASNVNTKFKNIVIKNKFGWIAEQHQDKKFNQGFDKLGELSAGARKYLSEIPLCQWSLCHDGGFRYGIKTTNLAEVFNNVLKGARYLPVIALVQLSFYRVNAYFVERRGWASKRISEQYPYSENVTKILEKNIEKAKYYEVRVFHHEHGLYQIKTRRGDRKLGKGGNTHTVSFRDNTCTCKKLQIYKIPCSHVLAVCREYSLAFTQFVDRYFSSSAVFASYEPTFRPIPDKAYWTSYNGPKVIVDENMRQAKGRPVSTRLKNEMDEARRRGTISCSICRQKGHNKKTCSLKRAGGDIGSSRELKDDFNGAKGTFKVE